MQYIMSSIYNNQSITLTFGDCAENHVGMQQIGTKSTQGFSYNDLVRIKANFGDEDSTIIDLKANSNFDNKNIPEAYILVIKNGVDKILSEIDSNKYELFEEQRQLDYDKKAFMYGRVVNKHARWNICFSDFEQEPDYENKMGRVLNYFDPTLRLTQYIKNKLEEYCFSEQLQGEGNYYYDIRKTGIGFHGDSERRKVIAVKLGEVIPLEYQWYYRGNPIGDRIHLELGDGDIYVMDEVATGYNWKRKNIYTLRHGAGSDKFLKI